MVVLVVIVAGEVFVTMAVQIPVVRGVIVVGGATFEQILIVA